jgi:hypothetical protein
VATWIDKVQELPELATQFKANKVTGKVLAQFNEGQLATFLSGNSIRAAMLHNAIKALKGSHHITSHHITSHHITSHHITSHHITSHHITHCTHMPHNTHASQYPPCNHTPHNHLRNHMPHNHYTPQSCRPAITHHAITRPAVTHPAIIPHTTYACFVPCI